MSKMKAIILASALAGSVGLAGSSSAQALTFGPGVTAAIAGQFDNAMVQQVQRRRFRGSRRGSRGIGTGAAIGLGILGLGLAGAAAANSHRGGYYENPRECWYERRPIYNRYGDYVGRRNVRVCN